MRRYPKFDLVYSFEAGSTTAVVTSLLSGVCAVPSGCSVRRTALGDASSVCVVNQMPLERLVSGNICNFNMLPVTIGRTRSSRFELIRDSDGLILDTLQACFDNTQNSASGDSVEDGTSAGLVDSE